MNSVKLLKYVDELEKSATEDLVNGAFNGVTMGIIDYNGTSEARGGIKALRTIRDAIIRDAK